MRVRRVGKLAARLIVFAVLALVVSGCGVSPFAGKTGSAPKGAAVCPDGSKPLTSFEEVADYIRRYGRLPDNFITKAEARRLGWDPAKGNLHEVAPCKSIGGDVFENRERKLPDKPGRIWYEADIDYRGGPRGPKRIVFSNDGLIYKTTDHYQTFEPMAGFENSGAAGASTGGDSGGGGERSVERR